MITLNTTFSIAMLALAAVLGVPPMESPFFCNLKALNPTERAVHSELTTRLLPAVRKTRELADGYAFELDPDKVAAKDLGTWVEGERRCCPFFDFQIEWRRESGPLTLRLTGREGVKEFIRVEFKPAFR